MLISTFELLVKNILPSPAAPPASGVPLGRTIIQGYFLTIANTSDVAASFELKLIAQSPDFELRPDPDPPSPSQIGSGDTTLLAFFDINGKNDKLPLPAAGSPKTLTFDLTIGARDTGLFILQPNVTKPTLISKAAQEIRGYSQISLKPGGASSINILLTPEHRGTFLTPPSSDGSAVPPDFDQLVYSLPTARGRSLYELTV
jgi:hypothetical protein